MYDRFINAFGQLRPGRQQRYAQGGVLVIGSAMLLVLVLMGALLWGISWRIQQRQRVQAALLSGNRVAAQRWNYAAFADGITALQSDTVLINEARQVLAANLANVPGLQGDPEKVAATATWTIVRNGGSCGTTPIMTTGLCGAITVQLQGLPIGPNTAYSLTATTVTTIDTR